MVGDTGLMEGDSKVENPVEFPKVRLVRRATYWSAVSRALRRFRWKRQTSGSRSLAIVKF